MPVRYYTAIVERKATEGFSVSFPDFPGCVTAGSTLEAAAANAEEALGLHLEGMSEQEAPIPAPTPMDEIPEVEDEPEHARLLVRADLPGRSQRIQISMDEGLLARIDAAVTRAGVTRSAYLAAAALARLRDESMG